MNLAKIRARAIRYFDLHRACVEARAESWENWKKVRGDSVTEQVLFAQDSRAKELVEDEQMYGRWAQLYATMATMEMLWRETTGAEQ